MPKIMEHSVAEVKRRAEITEVVMASGVALRRSGSSWAGKCPFHEEKSPSFHVQAGKGYRCFGCGAKGDALKFVMEREGLEFVAAVEKLAAMFAVVLEYEAPLLRQGFAGPGDGEEPTGGASAGEAAVAGNVLTLPEGVDPKAARRAIARQMRYEAERRKEEKLELDWIKAHGPGVERRPLRVMSGVVRARWQAGGEDIANRAELLAKDRGWPVAWVWWLIEEGVIAWPELPWREERAVAFRVDAPVFGEAGGRTVLRDVRAVGYHQRWLKGRDKNWLFVPWWASADDGEVLTGWRAEMVAAERARGADEACGLVPALPFFIGVREGLRLLVVSEGQWDAVTFAGAMGWLAEGCWPQGVAVMGARGSSGVDTLLAYWAPWLEQERPEVLVLADNDKAGRKWDVPEPTEPGGLAMPTFAQKLEAAGAARVVISRVKAEIGKDFNDYWRARRPNAAALAEWLLGLGLLKADGTFGRMRPAAMAVG